MFTKSLKSASKLDKAVALSIAAMLGRAEIQAAMMAMRVLGDGRVAMILDIHGLVQLHAQLGGGKPALALAAAKARAVSTRQPDAYVIGADQICVHKGDILSKPGSYDRAEAQLAALSGSTHQQHSAVVLARGGEIVWQHVATASLTMRALTADEIHAYVAADAPLSSCGSYKFEGLGRHLFSAVTGEQDVIQGLPLVPLLATLHAEGVITLG
mgnify:CR=1 FL=1